MDTHQNFRSLFRELRLKAGYKTITAVAQRLGFFRKRVARWEDGSRRPKSAQIIKLAEILSVEHADVVKALWGENIGDPCQCGIGRKTFSDKFPNSTHLAVEHPCAVCGSSDKRIYRSCGRHPELCVSCVKLVDPVKFTCSGCGYKKPMLPYRIRQYRKRQAARKLKRFTIDETTKTFRCVRCHGRDLIDLRLGDFTDEQIRTRTQRKTLMKDFHSELFPRANKFSGKEDWRTGKKPHSDQHRLNRFKSRLSNEWSGETLPEGSRFGHCLKCCKITISKRRSTNFHRPCYSAWCRTPAGGVYQSLIRHQKEPVLPLIDDRPGQWATEEDLKKYFAWSVQHYFGKKSYRVIGRTAGIAESFVRKKVKFILAKLPDPKLLPKPLQKRIILLLEIASQRDRAQAA